MNNEEKYVSNGRTVQYVAGTRKPELNELYDLTKYRELVKHINENPNITDDEKTFLKFAATRHINFRYDAIANYYANSDNTIKELMENSILIMLDIETAIERGYCAVSKPSKKDTKQQEIEYNNTENLPQ